MLFVFQAVRTGGAGAPRTIVLISLDTTRADHLGCYGYDQDTSPHIDELAEDAVTARDSRQGNYVAVTVRVHAESRKQMDAIYRELTAHESVTIAL